MAGISLKRSRQAPAEETSAFGGVAERFRRAGDLDRAITLCREGLQRFPDLLSARVTLGWALLDKGEFEEAQVELQHVLRRAPDNLAAIRGLAELHDRVDSSGSMESWHPPAEQQREPEPLHEPAAPPAPPAPFEVPDVESVAAPISVTAHVEAPAILSAAAAAIEAAGESLPTQKPAGEDDFAAFNAAERAQPATVATEQWNELAFASAVEPEALPAAAGLDTWETAAPARASAAFSHTVEDDEIVDVEELLAAVELAEALPAFDATVVVEAPVAAPVEETPDTPIELVSPAAALFDTDVESVDALALSAETPILSDYDDDDPRLLAELEQLAETQEAGAYEPPVSFSPVVETSTAQPSLHSLTARPNVKRMQVAALERFQRAVESRRLRLEAQSVA